MLYFALLVVMFLGAFAVAFRCMDVDDSIGPSYLRVLFFSKSIHFNIVF